jgi:hypothetical protein
MISEFDHTSMISTIRRQFSDRLYSNLIFHQGCLPIASRPSSIRRIPDCTLGSMRLRSVAALCHEATFSEGLKTMELVFPVRCFDHKFIYRRICSVWLADARRCAVGNNPGTSLMRITHNEREIFVRFQGSDVCHSTRTEFGFQVHCRHSLSQQVSGQSAIVLDENCGS